MDPVQSLLREATALERRLRADSMTWTSRVENLFTGLLSSDMDVEAGGPADAYGKGFAAMFLIQGVTGMPKIHGEDALQWFEKWKSDPKKKHGDWRSQVRALTAALPPGYGSEIGGILWPAAVALLGRGNAEDLVASTFKYYMEGGGENIKALPEHDAIKYLKNKLNYLAQEEFRKKRVRKEDSMTYGPGAEDEGAEHELVDRTPNIDVLLQKGHSDPLYKKLWDIIFTDPKLTAELSHIHPDVLGYLHAASQGHKDTEILGFVGGKVVNDGLLGHPVVNDDGARMTPANWNAKKKLIFKTIIKHFALHGEHEHEVRQQIHLAYDYDRRAGTAAAPLSDALTRQLVFHALEGTFQGKGFDAMMQMAFKIEAGVPPFDRIQNNRHWIEGILNELSRKIPLEPGQAMRLHSYRDDLRHGR